MVECLLVLLVFASICFFGNTFFQRARQAFTDHRQQAFERMLTTASP